MNTVKTEHKWLTLQEAARVTGKNPSAIRMWAKRKQAKGERILTKKKKGKHGDIMLIHYTEIEHVKAHINTEHLPSSVMGEHDLPDDFLSDESGVQCELLTEVVPPISDDPEPLTHHEHVKAPVIEFIEYYDKKRIEWEQERDKLMQGMMMYRYRFEELDRQLRLLPAPPEVVTSKLQELDQKEAALAQAQKILHQAQEVKERYKSSLIELKQKLQEEERAKEAFRIQWELAQAELKKPWWKKIFGMK